MACQPAIPNFDMSGIDGPDFICVGMPKAGTGWLYDQLQCHPAFWMPPVKEILYLNRKTGRIPLDGRRGGRTVRKLINSVRRGEDTVIQGRDRSRDLGFVQTATECNGQAFGLDRYISLFRFKGELLSGDISPMYTELDVGVIEELAERLPDTKLLLIARDPVARAWSRISMNNRGGKFDLSLLDDAKRFRSYLETSSYIQGKSFPTLIVEHWRRHAPRMAFRTFLFDDIAAEPDKVRQEIWSYLGADPHAPVILPADYNRKAKVKKLDMPSAIKEVLVEFFANEIKACAEMFGGRAREWSARYGLS
ncbi:MAG TPA: sulfotransferase [Rhizomicrobium sp.]|nr:sulfotransferase [Rhizomicrobium sp.]